MLYHTQMRGEEFRGKKMAKKIWLKTVKRYKLLRVFRIESNNAFSKETLKDIEKSSRHLFTVLNTSAGTAS